MRYFILYLFAANFMMPVMEAFAVSPTGSVHTETITHNSHVFRVRLYGNASDADAPNVSLGCSIYIRPNGTADWYYYGSTTAGQTVGGIPHSFDIPELVLGPGNYDILVYALGVDAGGNIDNPPDWQNISNGFVTVAGNPDEYLLTWWDTNQQSEHVRVIFNKYFGGAITKIHYSGLDATYSNLVDGSQAGAMFQSAFWLSPRHSQLPPGCNNTEDMWYDNPTQAGFVGDGWAGNPIGIMGTEPSVPDPKEIMQMEANNTVVHFKSRFIRYDYCLAGVGAPMANQGMWDTTFYIEQRAFFHPTFGHTLVFETTISNEGAEEKTVTSRQIPIIFGLNLTRKGYWKNGQKVVDAQAGPFDPDNNWACMLASNEEKGIGNVYAPCSKSLWGKSQFAFGNGGTNEYGAPMSNFSPGNGLPNLTTFGTAFGGVYVASNGIEIIFPVNSGVTFTMYFPIGTYDFIKATSESLLQEPSVYPAINCDDGNLCTSNDQCQGLTGCQGTLVVCNNDAGPCGALRTCNGTPTCTVTYPGTNTLCDDTNACTANDMCNGAGGCAGTPITSCINNDACCPAGCNSNNDNDCPPSCGNGVVEPQFGETCDPPASCPTTCDDNDRCTVDSRTGSASNCNVQCMYTAISACVGGDDCCPAGCTPINDSNCVVTCGGVPCAPGEICYNNACCLPTCAGKQCGTDGCGGNCGTCSDTEVCNQQTGRCGPGSCAKDCTGRVCGPDPLCGQSCGDCAKGSTCDSSGICNATPGHISGSCGCQSSQTQRIEFILLLFVAAFIRKCR